MVVKTKIVMAAEGDALDDIVNVFLADKDPANVLDITWGMSMVGKTLEPACYIVYQE